VALDTYANLQVEIAQYLGRSDLTAKIPTFIQLLEKRLNRDLRLRCMEHVTTLTTAAGVAYVTLPNVTTSGARDVFLEMRSLTLTGDSPRSLIYVTPDDYYAKGTVSGMPANYTIIGSLLYLYPVPDGAYSLSMSYYREIDPLANTNTTNPVLTNSPDVYLYGSLVESAPYTRSSAPLELWATYYKAGKDALMKSEENSRYTSKLGMRPIRKV
jgi:hypothetical protein